MSLSEQHDVDIVEATSSSREVKKITTSHTFKIMGHSLEENTKKGTCIESAVFKVGGYDWTVKYYPGGCTNAEENNVSITLCLKSSAEDVKAQSIFTVFNQTENGLQTISKKSTIMTYKTGTITNWGFILFAKREDLKPLIKDDCLAIKVVVTVFEVHQAEAAQQVTMITVPPVNIQHQFGLLLESGIGANVIFEVNGKKFSAHKCILAARSSVFSAQFFGSMKEKSDTIIKIDEMEPLVFKILLYFIYNDSMPRLEEIDGCEKKNETQFLAQHLLVAADRYDLERLRIICEDMLSKGIDKNNVITLLTLAERHSSNHLKAECVRFLASPGILEEIAATEQFQYLVGCPHVISKEPRQQVSVVQLFARLGRFFKVVRRSIRS